MRTLIIGAMLAAIAGQASAATWVPIGTTETGWVMYFDSLTVKPVGTSTTVLQVWIKTEHPPKPADFVARTMTLSYYNCTENTTATRSHTVFKRDGISKPWENPYAILSMSPVVPETMDEMIMKRVCPQP